MERANDRAFAALFYFRVGDIYATFLDYDKCSYWGRKSIAAAAQEENKLDYLAGCAFLAVDLALGERYKEALDLADSTISQYSNPDLLHKMYLDLARGISNDGLKQPSLAEKYCASAAGIADQLSSQPQMSHDIIACYLQNAWLYANRADKNKAKYYLQKALAINPKLNNIRFQEGAAWIEFKIDSIEGNNILALKAYQKYTAARDSIFSLRKAREIEEMGIQYGVAQKENDLELLEKKQLLQQAQLQREKFTRNIVIIATVLLAFLFALLYNRYRTKQRYNEEMDKKNAVLENLVKEKDVLIEDKDGLLKEKEWLIKEIHHRVKNNLQMVISLLNTQSKYLDNKEAIAAIGESRHRMQAMSLIHQKLYQGENTAIVNMQNYISELTEYLKTSFNANRGIYFDLRVEDIELDITQAIPIGLILNEAITNAIKYAFRFIENGMISVIMKSYDNTMLLEISDNGSGLPNDFDIATSNSMGMRLIKGLVKQIDGTMLIENEPGLKIKIKFQADTHLKSISREELLNDTGVFSSNVGGA